ncbi:hypothetical protein RRG08_067147 [Elysia crispata]|uniref:Uncharacterized protein n=1 Tax=Elysia crispata TaxID=231223 RepID=A0AAE1ADM1_9GAST|nr:hypothetical protein RRG08_067147 [Elysia crispata]
MFHIAFLLLLAGHELRLRPVGATSLTSQDVMEAGSMTSEESIRLPRLKRAVTDKPEYVPQKVTKKDRDSIRTVLEVAATNFFDHDVYYRANGTEVIEIHPGSSRRKRTLFIIRQMFIRKTGCLFSVVQILKKTFPGKRYILERLCFFSGTSYLKVCGRIFLYRDGFYDLRSIGIKHYCDSKYYFKSK